MVEFFIRRPIFATVCALLIVLAGAVSLPTIPISLYPDLAPPQVVVSCNYVGANSQDVESAIFTATRPLRGLLRRNGIQMLELGRAERSRVDDPDIWGSYFDHDPRIVAVVQHDPFAATKRTGVSVAAADFSVDARVF